MIWGDFRDEGDKKPLHITRLSKNGKLNTTIYKLKKLLLFKHSNFYYLEII